MATSELPNQPSIPENLLESRKYIYYSRFPESQTRGSKRNWRRQLRRIGLYARLVMVGVIMLMVGGILPVWLSYEIFFRPVINIACRECQIVSQAPYVAINYVAATAIGILGFMMPIFVLYIFIKIIRNQALRHELFQ